MSFGMKKNNRTSNSGTIYSFCSSLRFFLFVFVYKCIVELFSFSCLLILSFFMPSSIFIVLFSLSSSFSFFCIRFLHFIHFIHIFRCSLKLLFFFRFFRISCLVDLVNYKAKAKKKKCQTSLVTHQRDT